MTRFASVDELPAEMREQARAQLNQPPGPSLVYTKACPLPLYSGQSRAAHSPLQCLQPTPRKYRNEPIVVDGYRFDSKLEARYYGELKLRVRSGEVAWFIRQVRFDLPGRVIFRADFQEVLSAGGVIVTDCKGRDTQVSKNKRKQVYALYRVLVRLWPER